MKLLDVLTAPWAITPEKYREIVEVYRTHLRGEKIDIAGIEARIGGPIQPRARGYAVENGAAILPVHGVIAKRMNLLTRISGGASTELIGQDFREALADDQVERIILDIDSPGGSIDGIAELAREVYEARGIKPITALASSMMASGAYYIGSAADRVVISGPMTQVGSIGVIATHEDVSRMYENAGVTVTHITAGRYKDVGTPYRRLTAQDKEVIQSAVDHLYTVFLEAVALHRGLDGPQQAHDRMGDGRMFIGRQALEAGLADGVATLKELIATSEGQPEPPELPPVIIPMGGRHGNRRPDAGPPSKHEEETMAEQTVEITTDYLKEHHREVFDAVLARGHKAGHDDGHSAGLAEGADIERERIQAIRAQALPGHEALIELLAFDGKTTGPEAATQVLAAEKARGAARLNQLREDPARAAVPASEPDPDGNGADPSAPVEERCKAAWEKDAKLRAEFGTLEAYTAFTRQSEAGNARILGKG